MSAFSSRRSSNDNNNNNHYRSDDATDSSGLDESELKQQLMLIHSNNNKNNGNNNNNVHLRLQLNAAEERLLESETVPRAVVERLRVVTENLIAEIQRRDELLLLQQQQQQQRQTDMEEEQDMEDRYRAAQLSAGLEDAQALILALEAQVRETQQLCDQKEMEVALLKDRQKELMRSTSEYLAKERLRVENAEAMSCRVMCFVKWWWLHCSARDEENQPQPPILIDPQHNSYDMELDETDMLRRKIAQLESSAAMEQDLRRDAQMRLIEMEAAFVELQKEKENNNNNNGGDGGALDELRRRLEYKDAALAKEQRLRFQLEDESESALQRLSVKETALSRLREEHNELVEAHEALRAEIQRLHSTKKVITPTALVLDREPESTIPEIMMLDSDCDQNDNNNHNNNTDNAAILTTPVPRHQYHPHQHNQRLDDRDDMTPQRTLEYEDVGGGHRRSASAPVTHFAVALLSRDATESFSRRYLSKWIRRVMVLKNSNNNNKHNQSETNQNHHYLLSRLAQRNAQITSAVADLAHYADEHRALWDN
eukprot:PhM_4_TR17880/c1_g1_i3/m.58296